MACCGSFSCSKNSLVALNMLYMVIAFILIGVAAYAKVMDVISSFAILGSIIGCGVFLLLIGIMGLYGAAKHHQICLFFYMVILFLLFVVQFSLAVAMLTVSDSTRSDVLLNAWRMSSEATRNEAKKALDCCGYNITDCIRDNPKCVNDSIACSTCKDILEHHASAAFKTTGGVGLFFSFTEILGVVVTFRYRSQRDTVSKSRPFL